MKVYTSVTMRTADWKILEEESYEYEGPIAHCGGDGGDGGGGDGGYDDPGGLESYYGQAQSGVQATSGGVLGGSSVGREEAPAAAPAPTSFLGAATGRTAKAGGALGGAVAGPVGGVLGTVGGALYDIGGAQMQEHGITGADLAASEAEAAGMDGEGGGEVRGYDAGPPQRVAGGYRPPGQVPTAAPLPPTAPPKPFDPIPATVAEPVRRGTLGSTPDEVDEANRLRRERQSKFAESRAADESRMLSELVGGYGDTDRLRKDRTARQMFLGIPGIIAGFR